MKILIALFSIFITSSFAMQVVDEPNVPEKIINKEVKSKKQTINQGKNYQEKENKPKNLKPLSLEK